jgi:hypothetical protein
MRSHEQMTVRAADLAEDIVDEISQSERDWGAIERHARALVELLARLADKANDTATRPGMITSRSPSPGNIPRSNRDRPQAY